MSAVPLIPMLEREGLFAFEAELRRDSVYCEFGCGGSTVMAASRGIKSVYSVDTNRDWIDSVSRQVAGTGSRVVISHCDLGPVGTWGHPTATRHIYQFHEYAFAPWKAAQADSESPSLVLIDGRFRVACFLVSLAYAREGTVILFDDYAHRSEYHVVERYCERVACYGRLAKFVVTRGVEPLELMEAVAKYSIIRK